VAFHIRGRVEEHWGPTISWVHKMRLENNRDEQKYRTIILRDETQTNLEIELSGSAFNLRGELRLCIEEGDTRVIRAIYNGRGIDWHQRLRQQRVPSVPILDSQSHEARRSNSTRIPNHGHEGKIEACYTTVHKSHGALELVFSGLDGKRFVAVQFVPIARQFKEDPARHKLLTA